MRTKLYLNKALNIAQVLLDLSEEQLNFFFCEAVFRLIEEDKGSYIDSYNLNEFIKAINKVEDDLSALGKLQGLKGSSLDDILNNFDGEI